MPESRHVLARFFLACSVLVFFGTAHAAPDQQKTNSGVSAFPAAYSGISERIRYFINLENRDSPQLAAGSFNSCVNCHAALTGSSFVGAKSHDWKGSIHQKRGVTCDKCHGGNPRVSDEKAAHEGVLGSNNPQSSVYYRNIPSTCGKCHGAEFYKFKQSLHYKLLESTGKGAECVTCHGSMVTTVLTPDTVQSVCKRCHNERMGVFPYVPGKAKAVLLLLRESADLLDAEKRLYHPAEGTAQARHLRDAQAFLQSAKLDWHTFDLDAVTAYVGDLYNAIRKPHADNAHR